MHWNYAIINGRIGEIYYEKTKSGKIRFTGHAYADISNPLNPLLDDKQKRYIKDDTREIILSYRNDKYTDKHPRKSWMFRKNTT